MKRYIVYVRYMVGSSSMVKVVVVCSRCTDMYFGNDVGEFIQRHICANDVISMYDFYD